MILAYLGLYSLSTLFWAFSPLLLLTLFSLNTICRERISEETAVRQKLEHILEDKGHENNTMLVELANINDNNSISRSLSTIGETIEAESGL